MGLRLVVRCDVEVQVLAFGVPEIAAKVRGTEGDETGAAAVPVIIEDVVPAALVAGANSA